MTLKERLWKHIRKADQDDCWEWTGHKNGDGYGLITIDPDHSSAVPYRKRTSKRIASRVLYELEVGPVPEGLVVCHKCDNPPCCNPRHLRVGTQRDNVLDSVYKGRWRPSDWTGSRGEKNGMAKLTEETVRQLRATISSGERSKEDWARELGMRPTGIDRIYSGRRWPHVEGAVKATRGGNRKPLKGRSETRVGARLRFFKEHGRLPEW